MEERTQINVFRIKEKKQGLPKADNKKTPKKKSWPGSPLHREQLRHP